MVIEKKYSPLLRFPEFEGEWKSKKLGDICVMTSSKRVYYEDYVQNGVPFFRGKEITELKNNQKPTDILYISQERYNDFKNKYGVPKKDDILVTAVGTLGNVWRIEDNTPFYFKDGNLIWLKNIKENSSFLEKLIQLNTKELIKTSIGSTQKALTMVELRKISLNFPSLPEQQKIASFLSDVDAKITQLTKKKELLEQYKKGIMQKIFNQELRFKDDNGNAFPNWIVKKLGNICNYKNGGSFEQYVSNEGVYNLISLNSLDINGKLKPSHKKVTINDNSLDKGDLVMVLSDVAHGYFLGLTDIVPDNTFVLNQRMGALKPKININSYFLKTYINFNQKYFKLMGQGSSQQNLSKGDILKFTVKTPIIEEQVKIANFLSDIDVKIEVLNTKIENSKAFKKGLLQQMFV